MNPEWLKYGFPACWLILVVYWVVSARNIKPATRAEPVMRQIVAYWIPIGLALMLLGPGEWFGDSLLREQFVPHTTEVYAVGLAIMVAGLALACWSRAILGRNWSGVVQLKADHELVERGPYRVIRHPIYTGLLLMFLGAALKVGDWRGLLAVGIVAMSFWRKLRLEERWLTEQFGERYIAYRRRTRALLPFVV